MNYMALQSTEKSGVIFIMSTFVISSVEMTTCSIHTKFFDDLCPECRREYGELKGLNEENSKSQINNPDNYDINDNDRLQSKDRKYKEFSEERAKKLYGELLVQYLKKSCNEEEAAEKARAIIRKQCRLRDIPFWSWID
jgi:Zn-finger nucleic acid-binding protein